MPGIASADQTIGPINPAALIGRADPSIVEPRNVALLGDAFRTGFVTADDVLNRVGELGKTKDRAMIDVAKSQSMQAQEQMSPEAQAARAAQVGATTSTAQQAMQAAEKQKIYDQYPGVKYFEALAPTAFVSTPKLDDGTPDYAEMEIIGNELALDHARKSKAFAERENIVAEVQNGVISSRTKQGAPVASTRRDELDRILNTPFSRQAPGTAIVVEPNARQYTGQSVTVTPELRAQLASKLGPDTVSNLDEESLRRLAEAERAKTMVSPAQPTAQARPMIENGYLAPGGSGPPELKAVPMASEQQKGLAQAALTTEQLKAIGNSFQNLQKDSPWLTGPVMGRLGTLVNAANWDVSRADFERATTSMLANLAKGIYHETGVLSDKDIARYQKAMPSVNDTAPVAQTKLSGVTRDIFNSIDSNIETMRGQGQAISPTIQGMQDSARAELAKSGAASPNQQAAPAPVVSVPSGKKLQRDANGVYHYVQ